ncbi:MAG: IPExxxVDY family protein [Lentimicrobiaceae bacterium]|nr:IPExxxVDY family protein [Lentimicrobiaceae bacterium]
MAKTKKVSITQNLNNITVSAFCCIGAKIPIYTLAHFINKYADLNLVREKDFEFIFDKNHFCTFFYFCKIEEYITEVYLINNYYQNNYVFKDLKNIPYLLIIKGEMSDDMIDGIITSIRKINDIAFISRIDHSKIANISLFFQNVELHVQSISDG